MSTAAKILKLLSDGHFHSGTEAGQALGITRAAVCKTIKGLVKTGLSVHRVPGRGYRLAAPIVPLNVDAIRLALGTHPTARNTFEILTETDSTSAHLLRLARAGADISRHVCLAEVQRAGRGRRGRAWVATPFNNILFSIAWRFERGPAALAGLSLAAGVAVVEALKRLGVEEIGLKWPNDVLWRGRKLGGLLIDLQGEAAGPTLVVLGVGINVQMAEQDVGSIDQPWTDLATILGAAPDRNLIAARLTGSVADVFTEFEKAGFEPLHERWQALDVFAGKAIRIVAGDTTHEGIARGIDLNGGLRLESAEGLRIFHAGEASLRAL